MEYNSSVDRHVSIIVLLNTIFSFSYVLNHTQCKIKMHCSALKLIRNPWSSTIPASPAQPTSQTASSTSKHALVALSSISDRKWVQRKCVVCSHVHHRQQEVCWFCAECGENAVLCPSCTGHTCYQFHVIENGLPQWIQWASWHTYIDVWACALLYIVLNCSLLPNLHPFLFISYLMTIT